MQSAPPPVTDAPAGRKLIWDGPTRLFHWALVAAIATSLVSVNMNEMEVHFASGMVVLGLLIFRVIWGLVGPSTARFLAFFPFPARIRAYRAGRAIGHSPHGALATFALLGLVGAQVGTGLFVDDEIYLRGPLRSMVTSSQAAWATDLHALIPRILIAMIALHLAAIAFYTLVKKSDLLRVFLLGYRAEGEGIAPRPWPVIAVSVGAAAAAAFFVFN